MRRGAGPLRLRHRVGAAIDRHRMWTRGDTVAVAVSGGRDSVVLLDVLCETARWHGAVIRVVTVDHGTRTGSASDAAFVEGLARQRGLPIDRVTLALPSSASEVELRDARYAAFDALAVDRVAIGHHRADQAETLLLQLLRGAASRGRAAMAPVRGRYVRPLLQEEPADLAAWAQHRVLTWREDPSNQDLRFTRNRVRSEILPLLEAIRPGATRALARSASLARDEGDALDDLIAERSQVSDWSLDDLQGLHPVLIRRVFAAQLPTATAFGLDAAVDAIRRGYGRVPVAGGDEIVIESGRVHVRRHRPGGQGA